ncbi:hypothetical protein, partial [Xylophilus ampelinus]
MSMADEGTGSGVESESADEVTGNRPAFSGSTLTISRRDQALAVLCTIARIHQIAADPATLAHQMGFLPSGELSSSD